MTAPSIKEALEFCIVGYQNWIDWAVGHRYVEKDHVQMQLKEIDKARAALATLSPPAGERRDAIARLIEELLDAACAYEQHVSFTDGKYYLEELKDARLALNTALDDALASGLVQDEAAIRADEREKCATIADVSAAHCDEDTPGGYCAANQARSIALAIRSARDGGAES